MTRAEQVNRAVEGTTITGLLRRNSTQFPDHPALTSGIDSSATTLTWSQLRAEVAVLTRALAALGVAESDRVLIAMSKRPEHWITDLAAAHLGAIPCTTYDTLSTEQIRFVATHSAATVVVLEGSEQWERWSPVLAELPHLRAVVVLDPDLVPTGDPRFVGYAELRGKGDAAEYATTFERLTDRAGTDDPLCMVYTSGTTGDPKGVVLSHRNVIHESLMQEHLLPVPEHPRTVAYLPMAHIAERVLGIYMPICNAGHVTICADQSELLPTLAAVRPHGFFGVPRVWEKMTTGLQSQLATLPTEQRQKVDQARDVALRTFRLRTEGAEVPADLRAHYEQVDEQVLRPIRASLGLDECVRAVSGAAPIPVPVLEFLAGLGLPIYEVWGLSETTGAVTVSTPGAFTFGGVGPPAPAMEVRRNTDGELLVRGPVVFSGYLRSDGGIDSGKDSAGWFATGDVGTVDDRGIVSITDRKKEIIITAGGKNVAPAKVESRLRTHPLLSQAVVIGDRRPYLTALLVLDEETAPAWAKEQGLDTDELSELAQHPVVKAELEATVERVNEELSRVEQIKKHVVLGTAWTAESGELTPKLSVRRRVVEDRYSAEIERMYT